MGDMQKDQGFEATFDAIRKRRPVYSEILEKFHDLLQVQAGLVEKFAEHDFHFAPLDPERARQGVSWLTDVDLPECGEQLDEARRAVFPVLKAGFPIAEEISALETVLDEGKTSLFDLAVAFLDDNVDLFGNVADEAGLSAPVLSFAVRSVLSPVLAGMARGMKARLDELAWTQGHCPFCGSTPSIATLSRFDNRRDEALVGGGGKKRLTCSLCSHEWNFRRDHCPACGNDDHKTKELLFAEDSKHERIEACKKCGSYLLCVDLREIDGDPRMEVMPLGLIHLDLIARERNYSPMAPMPWNTAE